MLLLLLFLYLLTLLRFLCWKVSPLVYSFIRVFVWFSLPQLHDETMRDYVEVMFDPKVVMLASDLTRSSATTNGFVCCFFLQTIFPPLAFYFSFELQNLKFIDSFSVYFHWTIAASTTNLLFLGKLSLPFSISLSFINIL